jgi:hypothetical protein
MDDCFDSFGNTVHQINICAVWFIFGWALLVLGALEVRGWLKKAAFVLALIAAPAIAWLVANLGERLGEDLGQPMMMFTSFAFFAIACLAARSADSSQSLRHSNRGSV